MLTRIGPAEIIPRVSWNSFFLSADVRETENCPSGGKTKDLSRGIGLWVGDKGTEGWLLSLHMVLRRFGGGEEWI